ncbi:MAG: hypothetical protein KGI89_15630 [Euryarchaeota archaeon]|nr:hypothetical protein [Euryarchaeota archaeon]
MTKLVHRARHFVPAPLEVIGPLWLKFSQLGDAFDPPARLVGRGGEDFGWRPQDHPPPPPRLVLPSHRAPVGVTASHSRRADKEGPDCRGRPREP